MKVLMGTLLVLLCAMTVYAQEKEKSHTPATCCFSYISSPIPHKLVAHYYESSGLCAKRAIIFVARKGRHVCSNPSDAWVQQYIKELTDDSLRDPAGARQSMDRQAGRETPKQT